MSDGCDYARWGNKNKIDLMVKIEELEKEIVRLNNKIAVYEDSVEQDLLWISNYYGKCGEECVECEHYYSGTTGAGGWDPNECVVLSNELKTECCPALNNYKDKNHE